MRFRFYKLILFVLFFTHNLGADTNNKTQKISIKFNQNNPFHFAGFYMAKHKGFYKNKNLDLSFIKFEKNKNALNDVLSEKINFSLGSSSLLIHKSRNKNIYLLSALFESSPLVFLSLKNNNIHSLKDFIGKKVYLRDELRDKAILELMLSSRNIDISTLKIENKAHNIEDLINKKVDIITAYEGIDLRILNKYGLEVKMFYPKDYAFDFYDNILYTSQKYVNENPLIVRNFYSSSMQGWKYAFNHIKETAEFIYKNHNYQKLSLEELEYEGNQLKKHALDKNIFSRKLSKEKLSIIKHSYNVIGLIQNDYDLESIMHEHNHGFLNHTEVEWIKNNPIIKARVFSLAPLHFMDGKKVLGISTEYLNFIANKTGLSIEYLWNISSQNALEMMKNSNELDLLLTVTKTKEKEMFLNFSKTYVEPPLVIYTRNEDNSVQSLDNLFGKTIAIGKNFSALNILKEKYPKIKLKVFENTNDAIKALSFSQVDAYIGVLLIANYQILHSGYSNVKIAAPTPFEPLKISFGLQKDNEILLSIINKTLALMTQEDINQIKSKWFSSKSYRIEYTYIVYAILIFLVILSIILYGNSKLKLEIKQRKKSEKLFRIMFEQAAVGVILLNSKSKEFITANKKCCEIFDMSIKDLAKNDYENMTYEEDIFKSHEFNADLYSNDMQDITIEKRYILKNKKMIWVKLSAKKAKDEQKDENYTILMIEDISEQKDLELQKIEQSKLYLQQSKMISMGEMIGNIAHQWRQPLSVISLIATGIKLKNEMNLLEKDDLIEGMDKINHTTQHLSKTIDTFRNFFKSSNSKLWFNLDSTFSNNEHLLLAPFLNDDIEIIIEIDDIRLFTLENELVQVFLNILNNAKDALKSKQKDKKYIFIRAYKENKDVIIIFKDNAFGLKKEILNRVFEPYFTTKHKSSGTGVGLYMSEEIISKHMNGSLEVSNVEYSYNSILYTGAEFKITIPISLEN
ncbi:MAG: hypothetical protein COA66_06650 [Arcobacter sp.]|nr:MAG: hypothetical protein COA66_06650 [Arcobacter sp.]